MNVKVKTLVGNVPQPILGRSCLGVNFLLSFFLSLLLKPWNHADLREFMLHRVLSIASVKFVCCQIAIPCRLRAKLMCGSFQLCIWWLNLKFLTDLVFTSLLWTKLVLTLAEDVIIQTQPGKQDKNSYCRKSSTTGQILKNKFYNASDFDSEVLQRVRFWIEKITTR